MKGLKLLFLAMMASLQILAQTIFITADEAIIENENVLGVFSGKENISKELEPGEALVYSVKEVKSYPQIGGINRHIKGGTFEIQNEQRDHQSRTFSVMADVIESESMNVIIHLPEQQPFIFKKIMTNKVKSSYFVDGNFHNE